MAMMTSPFLHPDLLTAGSLVTDPAEPLAPAALPDCVPSGPGLASTSVNWGGLFLQRFSQLPEAIDLPGLRDDVLIGHLAGPVLVEAGDPRHVERRWIKPGEIGVTPAGQPVFRAFKGRPDVVLIHMRREELRAVAAEMFDLDDASISLVPKLAEQDEVADRFIRLLLLEAENPMAGTRLMIESLSRALMVHTLRRHSSKARATSEVPASMSPGRVRTVIDFMRTHLDENLSLAQLAAFSGLSPSHFARAFRAAIGQPPHRFLISLRVEKARTLLERTDLPVIEVGLQCGFSQPSHFATTFRKVTGLTPRYWRLSHRG